VARRAARRVSHRSRRVFDRAESSLIPALAVLIVALLLALASAHGADVKNAVMIAGEGIRAEGTLTEGPSWRTSSCPSDPTRWVPRGGRKRAPRRDARGIGTCPACQACSSRHRDGAEDRAPASRHERPRAGVRSARISLTEREATMTEMIYGLVSGLIWAAIIRSCLIAITAVATERAFLSRKSSGGAIRVYPWRGVETLHGGVAGSNSALRGVEEESQRWQIESLAIMKAMVWIVAGF
jgi:hypothetical protein